jgi:hypothetical protein
VGYGKLKENTGIEVNLFTDHVSGSFQTLARAEVTPFDEPRPPVTWCGVMMQRGSECECEGLYIMYIDS